MTVLPRLDNLIRLSIQAGHDAHRVFNGRLRYMLRIAHDPHEERHSGRLSSVMFLCSKMTASGHRKVRAFRVKNCYVPRIVDYVEQISLVVRTRRFRIKQIATHGVMPPPKESVPDNPAVFARHKDFHHRPQALATADSSSTRYSTQNQPGVTVEIISHPPLLP